VTSRQALFWTVCALALLGAAGGVAGASGARTGAATYLMRWTSDRHSAWEIGALVPNRLPVALRRVPGGRVAIQAQQLDIEAATMQPQSGKDAGVVDFDLAYPLSATDLALLRRDTPDAFVYRNARGVFTAIRLALPATGDFGWDGSGPDPPFVYYHRFVWPGTKALTAGGYTVPRHDAGRVVAALTGTPCVVVAIHHAFETASRSQLLGLRPDWTPPGERVRYRARCSSLRRMPIRAVAR
jgi:hypothetical protein